MTKPQKAIAVFLFGGVAVLAGFALSRAGGTGPPTQEVSAEGALASESGVQDPSGPAIPEGLDGKDPEDLTDDEFNSILDGYRTTNEMPVGDEVGNVVGYTRWDEYHAAGVEGPDIIEVWSYEDDSLVGYKLKYIGFVPGEEFDPGRPIEEIVSERFGAQQLEQAQRNEAFNELLNSLDPGVLAEEFAKATDD